MEACYHLKKLFLWLCAGLFLSSFLMRNAGALDYKFNMSFIYFGNSSGYTKLVDATQNSLNEVTPNYFSLDTAGNLVITNAASKSFVDAMHARGIRVVPYLTNDWVKTTGLNALNNREALAKALSKAADDYNLDGISLDFEGLGVSERDAYTDFVRLLYNELHPKGKTVTVAVAANPWGWTTGWQGSYDYAGLAQYCDYLMIMAYDESYAGSKAGPVSSLSFVEKSIQYAVSKAPTEKIVLGLPFYGRIWSNSGGYPKGYGISNTKIASLVAAYNGTVYVDKPSQSACAVITIGSSDTKPVIGGKALSAGTYTIWFDNEQTLKEKLALVGQYDIRGAGSWSLGQENSATWDYYKLWLNGCTFGDIQNSWAKDYILNAYKNNWVEGVTPDTFAPEQSLTRAEAAALLVRFLGLPIEENGAFGFEDTKGSWAERYINTARRYALIDGIGGNLFAPDRPVSRQELAVMLNNHLGFTATGGQAAFPDVRADNHTWSYEAISALNEKGIITGYPDGSFRPEADVSRAEMTALVVRTDRG
jgi:spore germination protein YaaH